MGVKVEIPKWKVGQCWEMLKIDNASFLVSGIQLMNHTSTSLQNVGSVHRVNIWSLLDLDDLLFQEKGHLKRFSEKRLHHEVSTFCRNRT